MPMPFGPAGVGGQFEPMPSGPPKKHATQSALDLLKPVQVDSLPEQDRRCNICMQDYFVKPTGPRSPYVETVRDEEDIVSTPTPAPTMQVDGVLTGGQDDASTVNGEMQAKEGVEVEGETPVEMPCGHVFGETCLKAWLYQSPTCPLCRVEVESYTEEPQPTQGGFPAAFAFEGPFPFAPPPSSSSDEMQVDPTTQDSADTETDNTSPPSQPQPQFGHLAFQFIFTAPPPPPPPPATTPAPATPAPTPTPATAPAPAPTRTPTPTPTSLQTPTPTISRPTTAHTIRHHPYARTPTPSPLSLPSVTDRPDLFCAQRVSGLCSHDVTDENLLRLECGHAFHEDCLDDSMRVEGYPIQQEERRCPRCRRWMGVLQ